MAPASEAARLEIIVEDVICVESVWRSLGRRGWKLGSKGQFQSWRGGVIDDVPQAIAATMSFKRVAQPFLFPSSLYGQ